MNTEHLNKNTVERKWYVIDADGKVLGRMSTRIANLLRGKTKPTFSPHVDGGDFIIVTNAEKVVLTGKKPEKKLYFRHTQYPGGIKLTPAKEMMKKHPDRVIRRAVWGMLPKGRLGRKMIRKLKIYSGAEHPHQAQKPEPITF